MNFIEEYKKGQSGLNKGIPFGDGLENLTHSTNGLQRARLYTIGSPPKTGKTTFVNYTFLISPYIYAMENSIPINWTYYSFEIDRISMEFDIATFFLFHDYGITDIQLENQTVKNSNVIPISADYLRGRILDDENNVVLVKESIFNVLKEVYEKRIIPLFGEYSDKGLLIKQGAVDFIEEKNNPTGIYKELLAKAEKRGEFVKVDVGNKKKRIVGYNAYNPEEYHIVITDHCRLLIPERGFTLKQTVDKYSNYCTDLRNWCGYSFANIIHTNRELSSTERLNSAKDMLYPGPEDIKETGNLSEDSDYVLTIFDPNDDRYRLKKHFGIDIKDRAGNPLYPNMRTIHLVESRHCVYPQHYKVNMFGNTKHFEKLTI